MAMTKSDYWNVSRGIASVKMQPEVRIELVQTLSRVFAANNPRFKEAVFSEACGVYVCRKCFGGEPFITTDHEEYNKHLTTTHL